MNAMLLAAGKGNRIRGIAKGTPKVLLKIQGRTLLEHNLGLLKRAGVRKVVINTHSSPMKIKRFISGKKVFGMEVVFSHERELLGTAGAVKKAGEHFRDAPFYVIYGDNLTDFDLIKLRRAHSKRRALLTLGVFDPRKTNHSGILAGHVELGRAGRVKAFSENRGGISVPAGAVVNAGVLMADPALLRYIPQDTFFDFSKDVYPLLLKKRKKIWTCSHVSYVLASDNPEALKRTKLLAAGLLRKGT